MAESIRQRREVRRERLIGAGVTLAFWTFLAALFTPQTYIANIRANPSFTWVQAFVPTLALFYVWAALTPLVLWLGQRFPFERRRWLRNLCVLFLMSLVVSFLHMFILRYVNLYLVDWAMPQRYNLPVPIVALLVGLGATNVLVYWMILAVSQALTFFRKYQERDFRLAQAQLQVLRMQLHPHFFFNTLNAISELVYRDAEAADRTITRLSELLRLTLDSGGQEVTLRDELEFLEKYIELEQMLFQERLEVGMAIDPGALDALVPNMILQPLVENAIRHGIAPRSRGGRVDISARARDGVLQLRVRDDGLGVPKDWRIEEQDGIGLANTRARLAYLYPDKHRFELEATEGGGLTVSLEIPFRKIDSEIDDEDQDSDS